MAKVSGLRTECRAARLCPTSLTSHGDDVLDPPLASYEAGAGSSRVQEKTISMTSGAASSQELTALSFPRRGPYALTSRYASRPTNASSARQKADTVVPPVPR